MLLSLANHNSVSAGCRAHAEGWVCCTGGCWVRGTGAVTGALAAHTLLQVAEKSGSEKLFQTDSRMLRGLHRLAQERFL